MTPTQLAYKAWLKTEKPLPYETSVESRKIELLDPVSYDGYEADAKGECYLCGGVVSGGIKKNKILGKTFTDHNIAKSPESDYVCSGCLFAIATNPSRRQALRWFAFCASEEGLVICNRDLLRGYLINPPSPPFLISAPTSQKKHIILKSRISYSRDHYVANLEEETIRVNRQKITKMIRTIESLMAQGLSKTDIEGLRFSRKSEISIEAVQELFEIVSEQKKDRMFALAIYAAQEATKEESECYLDLILTTKNWRKAHNLSTLSTGAGTGTKDQAELTCGPRSKDLPEQAQKEQLTLEDLLTRSNGK